MPTFGSYLRNVPNTNAFGGPSNPAAVYGTRVPQIPTVTGPNLSSVFPNLSGTNAAASSALASELTGQLSPSTIAQINDAAAAWGVGSGMPGSGIAMNRGVRDLGIASEQLQHQGIADYSSLIPSISSTQTVSPSQQANLNTEIGVFNAMNRSAPDPAAAGSYAQELFDKYLSTMSRPSGGTGGAGSQQGLPWWQQTTTPGTGSQWGPQITTTRTFPGGLQGFSLY